MNAYIYGMLYIIKLKSRIKDEKNSSINAVALYYTSL